MTSPNCSLALRTDGTVWAWGDNSTGVLGNGTTTASATPVQVAGLTGVTALAAGRNHSLVLRNDGTVWTWGDNSMGCLGNGTTLESSVPIRVTAMTGVTSIAANDSFSLAIRGTRELWGWGYGPLGDAQWSHHPTPVRTYLWSAGTFSIFAGQAHAVALERTQGTAWSWGSFGSPCPDRPGADSANPASERNYAFYLNHRIFRDFIAPIPSLSCRSFR